MEELEQPEGQGPEGQQGQDSADQGTKKVEGRDPKTVRLKREYEAEVEKKVATDYTHVVWAYGVIWAIFAVYGALLWRRASAQKADLEELRARSKKPTS